VSWYDAVQYCNWLSRWEGLTPCYEGSETDWKLVSSGTGYRLPTEAEWEYACRAGTTTEYGIGDSESLLPQYAVFTTSRAEGCGSKRPNGWGLFDMHGNVSEWCADWYGKYSAELAVDPKGIDMAEDRVLRGGGSNCAVWLCRSSGRNWGAPADRMDVRGFRVAAVRVR
jgi:formylglycine-generating enzyme required for sulfatase activity